MTQHHTRHARWNGDLLAWSIVKISDCRLEIDLGSERHVVEVVRRRDGQIELAVGPCRETVYVYRDEDTLWIANRGRVEVLEFVDHAPEGDGSVGVLGDPPATRVIVAPIAGRVVHVDVELGDHVRRGDRLMTMDAMKMEFTIDAHWDGVVVDLEAIAGSSIGQGELLLELAPAGSRMVDERMAHHATGTTGKGWP